MMPDLEKAQASGIVNQFASAAYFSKGVLANGVLAPLLSALTARANKVT